jgi:hypothetical protein
MKIDLSEPCVMVRNIEIDLESPNGNHVPVSIDMFVTRKQAEELLVLVNELISVPKKGTRVVIKC